MGTPRLGEGCFLSQDPQGRAFRQMDGRMDTSTVQVMNEGFMEPLRYSDSELRLMSSQWSSQTIEYVPGFRYWEMPKQLREMNRPENKTGDQQRAFDFYWQIRYGTQRGGICLGVGATTCAGPAAIGTDKFCGVSPEQGRYGETYGYPHMQMDADVKFPFYDNQFEAALANHVIEHVQSPEFTIQEMLRVVKPGGVVGLITPDMAYSGRGNIDPTHVREFSADEMWEMLMDNNSWTWRPFEVMLFNTLGNNFSFDVVLRKLAE